MKSLFDSDTASTPAATSNGGHSPPYVWSPPQITTQVIKVNKLSPKLWAKDKECLYVGRSIYVRSGKYQGEYWPNSFFSNAFHFGLEADREQRLDVMFRWAKDLKQRLIQYNKRELFVSLQGRTLGCWCLVWNGKSERVPFCHAAWLARIVDIYCDPSTKGAVVRHSDVIEVWDGKEVDGPDCVAFRKMR